MGVAELTGVEPDLHRQPLDDLDPVARGILRRQERKARARPGGERIHLAIEGPVGERVDAHFRRHARPDALELGLLVVRDDPDVVERHDGEKRLPHLRHLAKLDRSLGNHAVDGRAHVRVVELQLGVGEVGLGLRDRRLGPDDVGLLHRHLVPLALGPGERAAQLGDALPRLFDAELSGGERGLDLLHFTLDLDLAALKGFEGGASGAFGGLRLVVIALGDQPLGDELALPVLFLERLDRRGPRAGHVRFGGGGRRPLGLELGLRLRDGGLTPGLGGPRAFERPARLVALRRGHPARHRQLGAQG